MALIACPNCQHEVLDLAAACPQCGDPMQTANPYLAPVAGVADPTPEQTDFTALNAVARGQRMVLYALLISIFATLGATFLGAGLALVGGIIGGLMAIIGLLRMAAGMGFSFLIQLAIAIALFIPTVNWLVMLLLCDAANKKLKAAGYKLGLMGADPR